jgi:LysM repeat protein
MTLSQKQKALGIVVPKPAPQAPKPAPTLAQAKAKAEAGKPGSYTVQSGDTLWSISQKTGMSVEELKKLNGLTDARALKAGMVIKVKKA